MGFIRRMLLVKTSWSRPSWAHHQGPLPPLAKPKGQRVAKEVTHGQPGDLMLLGFGSQQARKSPSAPRDSRTPEEHGDSDATGSPSPPLCSHRSADTLEQGQPHPPPQGVRERAGSVLGRRGRGLRLTTRCRSDSSQLLKEQALAAPSHKHRWERVTLQLQLTNTRPAACRGGARLRQAVFLANHD